MLRKVEVYIIVRIIMHEIHDIWDNCLIDVVSWLLVLMICVYRRYCTILWDIYVLTELWFTIYVRIVGNKGEHSNDAWWDVKLCWAELSEGGYGANLLLLMCYDVKMNVNIIIFGSSFKCFNTTFYYHAFGL